MSVLTLENVTINYGQYTAVKAVSFKLEKGDFMCVIGNNGSGKSTLIKAIMGLIPYSGSIKIDGDRSKVAYVPQQSTAVSDFPATVKEVVLTGRMKVGDFKPFYSKEDHKACEEAMALFGISDLSKKWVGELSGGQEQRVMLARGYVRHPDIFILDEPDAALDQEMGKELYDILHSVNKEKNMTILMISHQYEKAEKVCNKVTVIEKSLIYSGPVEGWHGKEVCYDLG